MLKSLFDRLTFKLNTHIPKSPINVDDEDDDTDSSHQLQTVHNLPLHTHICTLHVAHKYILIDVWSLK